MDPEASMIRIGKSEKERREAAEAVAKYDGPVTHCEPGRARGHEPITELRPNPRNRAALSKPDEQHETSA
jgi:hypothetical protein